MSKNRLQEYYQAKYLPLPEYFSERYGGSDHIPQWGSKVKIFNPSTNSYSEIIGNIFNGKSAAEASAAEAALLTINLSTIPIYRGSVPPLNLRELPDKTALLVDIENLPKFVDEVLKEITGIDIYAFIGHHHCLSEKIFPEGVIKVLSPSTRSDGSDTCMQVYVGFLLAQEKYDTYLIATRDHYGSALVDILTSDSLLWKGKHARVVTQISHI